MPARLKQAQWLGEQSHGQERPVQVHPVGRKGEYLVQEAPISDTLLGQPGGLTRVGLESRDKTHTLVPSPQEQGDRVKRLRVCRPVYPANPTLGR